MRGKIPRDELLHDLEIERILRANRKAICLAQLEEDTLKEAESNSNQILIEVPKIVIILWHHLQGLSWTIELGFG